jgi:hypothetical protein
MILVEQPNDFICFIYSEDNVYLMYTRLIHFVVQNNFTVYLIPFMAVLWYILRCFLSS